MTMYGRGAERVLLEDAVAAGAPGSTLALVGEAGIGKTRLARHAGDAAAEAGRAVVEGHTVLGLAEPLGVVCDAVRAARRSGLDPGPARDPLASGFPPLVLPELGGGAIERGNLGATFEAAARYLRALAGRRGLLLVLEDLHWADATSLSLVPFLARVLAPDPVVILLTYRPDDDSGNPALAGLRSELRRGRLGVEIAIGPLEAAEAEAMLASILGVRPAPDARAELLRLSGGNPFALEELARAAVDSGWIDPASGRRRGRGAVSLPWTLAESIRARAGGLPPAARELIAWAAAIGERFDRRLIADVAEVEPAEVLAGLSALVAAGLIVEDAGDQEGNAFSFRHALVHEALSQEGLSTERRGRHARILAAGEDLTERGVLEVSSAELARHAVAAGDRERGLALSRAAAAHAQDLGAVTEALAHLDRALALWTTTTGPHSEAICSSPAGACGHASLVATNVPLVSSSRRAPPIASWKTTPRRHGAWPSWPRPDSMRAGDPRRSGTGPRPCPSCAAAPRARPCARPWPPTRGGWRSTGTPTLRLRPPTRGLLSSTRPRPPRRPWTG